MVITVQLWGFKMTSMMPGSFQRLNEIEENSRQGCKIKAGRMDCNTKKKTEYRVGKKCDRTKCDLK